MKGNLQMSKVTKNDAINLALCFSNWCSHLRQHKENPTVSTEMKLKVWGQQLAEAQIDSGVEMVSKETLIKHCGKVFTVNCRIIVLEAA
tara:strand:- start:2868 stop:3134 length:267 start_codon:yes stop_codon:yes gene_type:complete